MGEKSRKKRGAVMRRTREREVRDKHAERIRLINAALDEGHSTRKAIMKVADLKAWELQDVFQKEKQLYAKYVVRRRTLVDMAADNIASIVADEDHPQHFQASKYVLQNYKSDLDSTLERHEEEEMGNVDLSIPQGERKPIRISFRKRRRDDDDD